ncbi:type II toxin-antitoxin system RelE/ParE family toxin [Neptunomonas sp.]|uniref:type II toxin-antitoxin system RelE/ParE family toxin n=1 Tax=Neptunomonas sp. TaxID=1971898 RepID=UPI00356B4C32
MRVFKNKAFNKWAAKEGLSDDVLLAAVDEMARGLVDADLGGHVVKKRVALAGRGKSGGVRTLLAYKVGNKAFFVYGFAKNVRANIKDEELKALKRYARELLSYSDKLLTEAIKYGELIEVENDG